MITLDQQMAAVRQAVKDARREQEKADGMGKLAKDADLAGFYRDHIAGLEEALKTLEATKHLRAALAHLTTL